MPLYYAAGGGLSTTKVTHNTQTGSSYTPVLGDAGAVVEMNNSSTNTVTIPPAASVSFPVGTFLCIRQVGAGQTTIAAGAAVTLWSRGGALKLPGQWAEATCTLRAADEWVVTGELSI